MFFKDFVSVKRQKIKRGASQTYDTPSCDHQHAIEAYCRDWELSGIIKSLPFAQKVNQTGHVLNLKPKRKFDEYM